MYYKKGISNFLNLLEIRVSRIEKLIEKVETNGKQKNSLFEKDIELAKTKIQESKTVFIQIYDKLIMDEDNAIYTIDEEVVLMKSFDSFLDLVEMRLKKSID
jgi:hypothetical protein